MAVVFLRVVLPALLLSGRDLPMSASHDLFGQGVDPWASRAWEFLANYRGYFAGAEFINGRMNFAPFSFIHRAGT